ncbi:MAG: IclR family transcriptional regulator [Rhizobiaceae bacterium]|nr:IclR family transcriptional regulator [Rhizobiaceae bacterium]
MRVLQSLMRGLNALDYLRQANAPVRLTDISNHLDVDKSNASHLMRTLIAAGYAQQADGRKYELGEKLVALKNQPKGPDLEAVIALREAMHPTMEHLVDTSQECAHMAVLVGHRVWYVDKVTSPLPLKVDHPVGSLAPLHCTALGKAFLAFGSAIQTGALTPFTTRTIIDPDKLEAEIKETRRRGYAIDDEEYSAGIRCVAVPIYAVGGNMVAAVGLSGPSARIQSERLQEFGEMVIALCASQNQKLNGNNQ